MYNTAVCCVPGLLDPVEHALSRAGVSPRLREQPADNLEVPAHVPRLRAHGTYGAGAAPRHVPRWTGGCVRRGRRDATVNIYTFISLYQIYRS